MDNDITVLAELIHASLGMHDVKRVVAKPPGFPVLLSAAGYPSMLKGPAASYLFTKLNRFTCNASYRGLWFE